MIVENEELIKELCVNNHEFHKLFEEHIRFEQDLEALYSLKYFPPEVEQNIKDIKILKLRGKDKMHRIIEEYKQSRSI